MKDSLFQKILKIVNLFKEKEEQREELANFTNSFFTDVQKFFELSSNFVDSNKDRLSPAFALQFMALSAKMLERAREYDDLVERQQKQSREIADQLKKLMTN